MGEASLQALEIACTGRRNIHVAGRDDSHPRYRAIAQALLPDLDIEAAALCRALNLPMQRAAAVNDHPAFLDLLAELTRNAWARGGRALPIVPSVPSARIEPPPPERRGHPSPVAPVSTTAGTAAGR